MIEVMSNQILRINAGEKERREGKETFPPFYPLLPLHVLLSMTVLMVICVACSNSPVEEENNQDKEAPDLEKILKDMVLIPAGEFLMGSLEGEGDFDEYPQRKVYLDAFYIDKYEVTNAQFKEFVDITGYVTDAEREGSGDVWNPLAGRYSMRRFNGVNWQRPNACLEGYGCPKTWENYTIMDKMNYPVVQVSWNDAWAYATWAGKRLPTEAEWEKASRGIDGRRWPWGDLDLNIEGLIVHANISSDGPMPVGSIPTGISPYGIYNMVGNVREWVADWYASDYYITSSRHNPKGPDSGRFRSIRGGSWRHQKVHHVLITNRAYQVPTYRSNFVGFRCAWSK